MTSYAYKLQVFTKLSKGHPHETIALPTIRLGKTLDDLYPSDEEEHGEERELQSTQPLKVSTHNLPTLISLFVEMFWLIIILANQTIVCRTPM